MVDYVRKMLTGQFEASLCMLKDCIQNCAQDHWNGKIARYAFWQVAYHTLCFVDLYLSPNEASFQLREFHPREWSEFRDIFEDPSKHFDKSEILAYLAFCRQKAIGALASETRESLERESGFPWLRFSRGELHVYNIRHVQHHTGQLSAYLRRVDPVLKDPKAVRWVSTGWR